MEFFSTRNKVISINPNGLRSTSIELRERIWNVFYKEEYDYYDKIRQSSVTIVLIGKDTGGRWWVDWEIYYSMLKTVGNERNGVLGILLPNKEHNIPNRILENSDYCEVISMPHSKFELEQAIERAYSKRFTMPNLSSPLRKRNS